MNRATLRTYDVQNAIARAKAMRTSGDYEIKPTEAEEGRTIGHVAHKTDFKRAYFVETTPGHSDCTCPQFAKAGICKHFYFAQEHEEEAGTEARAQAGRNYIAANAAAKVGAGVWDMYDKDEQAQRDHNAGREIAWLASTFNDRIY